MHERTDLSLTRALRCSWCWRKIWTTQPIADCLLVLNTPITNFFSLSCFHTLIARAVALCFNTVMSPGASHLSQLAPLISGGRKGPGLEGQEGHNGDSRETPIKRVVQSTRSASRASLPRSNKGTITNYFASPKIYSRAAEGGVVDGPVTRARSSRKESPDHRTPRSGVSQRGEITRASVKECLDSGPVGSRDSLQVPAQTSGSDADDDDDDEFVPGMPKGRFWLHRIEGEWLCSQCCLTYIPLSAG